MTTCLALPASCALLRRQRFDGIAGRGCGRWRCAELVGDAEADVPHLDALFIDEVDPTISPVKAKGVGELGLTGVAPAIANAVYNATGVRVREYPVTLEKHLEELPAVV